MLDEVDFVYNGPFYKVQKWSIHPENVAGRTKPNNVLWTSPLNPDTNETDWMRWCRNEGYEVRYYEQGRYHIVPHKDCKILTLLPDSPEIAKYTITDEYGRESLDFEAIAKDYDALYAPKETMLRYRDGLLAGCDVASCIFLKPKYSVMNDKKYALYKAGKISLKDGENSKDFTPQVNLHPRSLPPLAQLRPVDCSVNEAVLELRQMAKAHSKRTMKARYETFMYYQLASKLQESQSFDLFKTEYYKLKRPEILNVMLKHGMNPDMKTKIFGYEFALTEILDDEKCDKLLLQYGCDANAMLAHYLEKGGSDGVVKLCLAAGADVNFSDENRVKPLMKAWKPEHMELLLAFGADPLAVDRFGRPVREYFNKQLLYHLRTLDCKILDEARGNISAEDLIKRLKETLSQR